GSNIVTFDFRYAAPATIAGSECGVFTFIVWVNDENADLTCFNTTDYADFREFTITVSCANDGNACTTDTCSAGTCGYAAAPNGTLCRAASGNCDVAETCDGVSTTCPSNAGNAA